MKTLVAVCACIATVAIVQTANAFCGFYVARADTSLFNEASQVVLVRDGNRTVLTMANDFAGDVSDFAMVIPVPTFIEREQINVADRGLIEHLDAYTAPRLVEYFDPNPCVAQLYDREALRSRVPEASSADALRQLEAKSQGVTIEASYTVGEYDILLLSAEESNGLIDWLNDNGYRIPAGADRVVGSYLKQDMRFFVAKVNLAEQAKSGFSYLRPLQIAFESNRFMLPIRLGTLNAAGQQELYVYALTRTGRVETTNYRTVRLPSNVELPEFVKDDFGDFYRDMFRQQTAKHDNQAVFLEYAWDMAWCDPCAADPLSAAQLRKLGVFWVDNSVNNSVNNPAAIKRQAGAQNVFVTRLHVRYDQQHFPEDLKFQETGDRSNFQGRYIVRHPFRGETACDVSAYQRDVRKRQEREAGQLASLTGWEIDTIRDRIEFAATEPTDSEPWWRRLWK